MTDRKPHRVPDEAIAEVRRREAANDRDREARSERRKPTVTIRVRWRPDTVAGHTWADEWMNEFSLNPRVDRALTDDELTDYFRWGQHATEGEVVEVVASADTPDDDLLVVKLLHIQDGVGTMRRVAYNRMTVFGEGDATAEEIEHNLGNGKAQLPHPDLAAAWKAWEAAFKP
jgi:hypothetical protein